jgi:hypothetical protein
MRDLAGDSDCDMRDVGRLEAAILLQSRRNGPDHDDPAGKNSAIVQGTLV